MAIAESFFDENKIAFSPVVVVGQGSAAVAVECIGQEDVKVPGKFVGKFYKASTRGKEPLAAAVHEYNMLQTADGCQNVVQCFGLFHMATQPSLTKMLGFRHGVHGVHKVREAEKAGAFEATHSDEAESEGRQRIQALFMEQCDFSLQDFPLFHYTESEAAFVCNSVLKALSHLHARGIVHRDVKPANILVANGGDKILLGDFGLASLLNPETNTVRHSCCGTHGFMAPECLKQHVFHRESDVFSLGAVLYQLLFQIYAFVNENDFQTDAATCLGYLPLIPCGRAVGKSDQACHLIRWLLEHFPEGRPTAAGALNHTWFRKVEQVTLRSFIAEKDERGAEMEDFSPVVHQNAMRKSQQDDVFKASSTQWTRSFSRLSTWRAALLQPLRSVGILKSRRSPKVAPEFDGIVVPR